MENQSRFAGALMKYLTIPCLLVLWAGCSTATTKPLSPEVTRRIAQAREFLAQGDPDSALQITDELLNADSNLREPRLLAAEANVALVDRGRGAITESFLDDAIRQYELALRMDEDDPDTWLLLAKVYRKKGEYRLGKETAEKAASVYGESDPEGYAHSALEAAENDYMVFVRSRQAELAQEDKEVTEETVLKADLVLRRLNTIKDMLPAPAYARSADVYAWLNRSFEQIRELERGIQSRPDLWTLHERYRNLRASRGEEAECVAKYHQLVRDGKLNMDMVYAQGMAESALADKQRRDGDRESATRNYRAAIRSFEQYRQNKPEHKANCDHWIAIEYLSLAKINEQAGEIEASKNYLKKAFATTPTVAETNADGIPLVLDSSRKFTYFGTMSHLGRALMSGATRSALTEALAFWEEFLVLHPRKFGWMYNNAGFAARDLGTAIETEAAKKPEAERKAAAIDAMKVFERSYQLYTIATELSPDDERIVNDRGLMLLFHLKRDFDLAEKLFRQAIVLGKKKLADMDESTPVDERNTVEEAVGDAYQNVGQLYMDGGKAFAEYAEDLRESLKYYPYQNRQSARWLRSAGGDKGTADAGATPARIKEDPRAKPFAAIAEAAGKKASANDFDGALLVLDAAADQMRGFAPWHYYQGLYALRYAQKAVASGGSNAQIEGLLADARNHLQKSLELDGEPIPTRLHLAEANYDSGEFANAARIAQALVGHISSRGGATETQVTATQRLRALSGANLYIADKQAQKENGAELDGARNAFRNLQRTGKLDAKSRKTWATLEQWAGNKTAAVDVCLRAAQANPEDQTILGELVETARLTGQSQRAVDFLAARNDAGAKWYLGMARYYLSFEHQSPGDPAKSKPVEALAALDLSIASFQASAVANAAYKASCDQWIGICQGTKGFNYLDRKMHTEALPCFVAAAKTSPTGLNSPISAGRSVKTGIELIVHHYYSTDDLAAAIATLQKACAAIPNDGGLSNNLGLFARDHGSALERDGKTEEAKKLFAISYDAYRNSVRLEPKSVRQRNDLVVMQLYHAQPGIETAVATLEECVADGEKQLAESPPVDEQELRDLQESVGDSYENLGYYNMKFSKDHAKARKYLEKSLEFYPFKERRSVQFLGQLDR